MSKKITVFFIKKPIMGAVLAPLGDVAVSIAKR